MSIDRFPYHERAAQQADHLYPMAVALMSITDRVVGGFDYSLFESLRSAGINPDAFWREHLNEIKTGFSNLTQEKKPASLAIVIPSHNETGRGHLQACLFGISRLTPIVGENVQTVIVNHNSSHKDRAETAKLVASIDNPFVEMVEYNTNLKGPSFPTQAAFALWTDEEIKSLTGLGIIDADTVINPQWLVTNNKFLEDHPNTLAIAGSRRYIDSTGQVVPYGEVKYGLESLSNWLVKKLEIDTSTFVKLVSGNSYFRLPSVAQIIRDDLGHPLTDGDIQRSIISYAGRQGTAFNLAAYGVSDGTKFTYNSRLSLFKTVLEKTKTLMGHANINDHLTYLLNEIPHYFPDFLPYLKDFPVNIHSLSPEEKKFLLEELSKVYTQFSASCQSTFLNQDMPKLRNARAGCPSC